MKTILIGHTGMLGTDMKSVLEKAGHQVHCFNSKNLDITIEDRISQNLNPLLPCDFIINCAAYTKVDNCETEKELAFKVNAKGPENIAKFCSSKNIPLIHFSTDYVFDGQKKESYLEDDQTNPINVYGESKLAGEKAIQDNLDQYYIFRIQWLYGQYGPNFIKTILKLSQVQETFRIIFDQQGSPSWTRDIANLILPIIENKPDYGIYHLHNEGYTNWADYARLILELTDKHNSVLDVTSDAYTTPAKRPKNSKLNMDKFLKLEIAKPRPWQEALKEYLLL